jgi:hypothetical protein
LVRPLASPPQKYCGHWSLEKRVESDVTLDKDKRLTCSEKTRLFELFREMFEPKKNEDGLDV